MLGLAAKGGVVIASDDKGGSKRRFWAIWCNEIAMEFKSQIRTEAAEEPRRGEDLASQLDLYGAVSNRQSSDVYNSRFNSYRLHQRVTPLELRAFGPPVSGLLITPANGYGLPFHDRTNG